MNTAGWLLLDMGWRVRRNKDPVPTGGIVVAVGVVETVRSIRRLRNMGLVGGILLRADEENLVVDCVGVEGLLGGNVAEDSESGCFLGGEASHLKDHPYTCARVEDQGRVGPRQSWLDRVRPKEHKEWKAKVGLSGMIQITRATYTVERTEEKHKNWGLGKIEL